jgi:hypothetical protein
MKLRITTVLTFLVAIAYGQETIRPWMPLENRIGIALGIGKISYLDKNSSPLIYQSKPKNVRLFYNLESNDMLFTVEFDVKVGGTKAKNHQNRVIFFEEENYHGEKQEKKFPVGGSFISGKVSVGAFYKIKSTQESTFKVAVGGRIQNEMLYPQGWNNSGIMNAFSFSPEAVTQHRVDQHHSFSATLRIPVATYLTRLPYHNSVSNPNETQFGGFMKNSKWVGVKKFVAPVVRVAYDYNIDQHWGAGLNYEFNWYYLPGTSGMKALSQSILANVYHQF